MRLKILLFLCLLLSVNLLTAQVRNCGSHEHLLEQIEKDPERKARLDAIESHTEKFVKNNNGAEVNGIITIPVVVHVVYNSPAENISAAQIQTQIDVLNEDFRRMNSDANNTWSQAADSEIEFCMADVDPNGNATDGITRTSTTVNGFGTNDAVKFTSQGGIDAWPAADYLNIWVCNIGGGILGYAQFPGGSANTDGVVNGYQYFGTIGTATAPFNLGRTMTHEVGHYLNLRHIWGDGGCGVDDFVTDTPTSDGPNYGCATGHTSCSTTDMVENYMDYSDDGCMNLYTQGQKTRMRALFEPGGFRESLLTSTACSGSGSNCSTPGGLASGNTSDTETTISWNAASNAQSYDLQYRATGTSSWTTQNVTNTSYTITGLTVCTGYEFQVRSNCANESSSYTSTQTVSTTGCPSGCPNNNEVTITITPDNYGSETTWEVLDGSTVLYSGGPYTNGNNTPIVVDVCLDNGCYDFVIYDSFGDGICCSFGNGSYSVEDENGNVLASGGTFASSETTNFCLGPPPANCPNNNEVTVNINTDNYGSETTWEILDGSTVLYSGGPYANNTTISEAVCLDNGCYDFAIYDSYGDGICCGHGNGSYSVEDENGNVLANGGDFDSLEVTNFCIGSTTPPASCDRPLLTKIQYLNGTSNVKAFWTPMPGATNYKVRYRIEGSSSWTTRNSSVTSRTLTGIEPNQTYEVQVRTICSSDKSSYTLSYRFSRDLSACTTPVTRTVNQITEASAKIHWHELSNATQYRIAYRELGTSSWSTKSNITSLNIVLTSLSADTNYEYKLRGYCSGTWTSWSGPYSFSTSSSASREAGDLFENIGKSTIAIKAYPNPSNGSAVNVTMQNISEQATLRVFSMMGTEVRNIQKVKSSKNQIELNLDNLKPGVYIIRVDDGDRNAMQKLTIVN